jgi:hypothetical protein
LSEDLVKDILASFVRMNLFFIVNGNAKKILEAQGLQNENFEIYKIDEKALAKPRKILPLVRNEKYQKIYFGCISIEFQRFIPFMLIYILLSRSKKGGIIDEEGKKINFSVLKTTLVTIPLLFVELIGSVFIVIYSYFYYFYWRKFKTSN